MSEDTIIFKKVFFEITNLCNLSCPFCSKTERLGHLIEPAFFRKIIREIAPLTERVLLHLKGEPLLHPDFSDFIFEGERLGLSFELATNGLLLEKHRKTLLSSALVQINFSLHALLANKISDLDEKIENILDFIFTAEKLRPDLYINLRFWDLKDTLDSPQNSLLDLVLSIYGTSIDNLDLRKKKSFRLKGRTYLHFDTSFIWPSIKAPVLGDRGFCYGLLNQLGILSDGRVVPCCLDAEGEICLGNLRDKSLEEILNGQRALNFIKNIRDNRFSEELCKRCSYARRFSLKKNKRKIPER